MAEQEIIKHAEKVIKTIRNKKFSFWHKLKDALYEIAIIVFAVTISIWFHNWSEHRQQQSEVKEFLLELKKDINADIADVKENTNEYKDAGKLYSYLRKSNPNKIPDNDSLKIIADKVNMNFTIDFHEIRFNGFSSAGKITNIENRQLQFDILNYYQNAIPQYQRSESGWNTTQYRLMLYMKDSIKNADDDKEKWQLLTSLKAKNIMISLTGWQQLYDRLDAITSDGQSIIKQIDKLYPNGK